ncbi:FAD-binding monooxygenase [Streptosporangium pseudovulgare]|uniref:FAD-binding monooxygenase n=2 Tax=Streptosporangium pseudovulgare TaxID=35765 RepID=A0ABQ2RJG5_9ACTN|nr:FAD-binding monooxygenase [Streptosporangium pseudovulgare]
MLSMERTDSAVVIGASIGGLLAARALSETHAEVTVVDRDLLPEEAASRRGVPQGRQLHVLLARGREAFDELFPGLTEELAAMGAPLIDLQEQVHWYNDGYRMRRVPSPLVAFGISRPLLEHVVRARVAALPGVNLVAGCEVTSLVAAPGSGRVTGVRVRPRAGDTASAAESVIHADLVVDAGGRGSRSPVWLQELGYAPAAQEQVRVGITYVTRTYRREPHHLGGLLGAFTNATPELPRAGIVAAQENGTFAVVLSGMLGEEPPTDDEGMARYAATLTAPQIAEVVRSAVPLSAPVRMRYPASVRRRYERLRRFPDGYLVMADALCSFNPVYGQGMTVAALEALLLRRLLTRGADGLARRFFRGAARIIDAPWSISVGTDLRFPGVEGRRTATVRFVNAYVNRVHAAATTDPVVGAAFLRVLNLIDAPARLLAPTVALRILWGLLGRPAPAAPRPEAELAAGVGTGGRGAPS